MTISTTILKPNPRNEPRFDELEIGDLFYMTFYKSQKKIRKKVSPTESVLINTNNSVGLSFHPKHESVTPVRIVSMDLVVEEL